MAVTSDVPYGEEEAGADSPLTWQDYLEVAVLLVSCILALLGHLAVLRVSLSIRNFSRHISILFCGILCADVLVCTTRIPATVYLIFSPPYRPGHAVIARLEDTNAVTATAGVASSPMISTNGLVDDAVPGPGRRVGVVRDDVGVELGADAAGTVDIDVACEVLGTLSVGFLGTLSVGFLGSLSVGLSVCRFPW